MSKLPLDLSKFKKIKSDKNTSTLLHSDGHQLTIAHNRLAPKLKAELDKLPMDRKKFADGGDTIPVPATSENMIQGNPAPTATTGYNPNAQVTPDAPLDVEQVEEQTPNDQNNQTSPPPAQATETQPQDQTQAPSDETQTATDTPTNGPYKTPLGPQPSQTTIDPQAYRQATGKDLATENMLFEHDLTNQHITPETYHDLFAKKSTMGKIGTLFGLMVSGAGAGLTHQSNAVLAMMQKEIDNDLEAQKQSANNAQNFLRINQQQLKNKSDMALQRQQAQLTAQQAQGVQIETAAKAFALAKANTMQTTFHELAQGLSKVPPGTQQEAYRQMLGLVYSKMGEQISDQNDAAAGAASYAHTVYGTPDTTSGQTAPIQNGNQIEQNFQNRIRGIKSMGTPQAEAVAKDLEEKHFPNGQFIGQASAPLTPADKEKLSNGVLFDQQLSRFKDWTSQHSGDLNPVDKNYGKELAAQLGNTYRAATNGGVYKSGEQTFINSQIDPNPTKFFNYIRVMPQLNAIQSQHKAALDQVAKNYGFQGYAGAQPPAQSPLEGRTATGPNGQKIIYKNGQWVPFGGQ